jgi:two-component system sensor histidine kinase YesM
MSMMGKNYIMQINTKVRQFYDKILSKTKLGKTSINTQLTLIFLILFPCTMILVGIYFYGTVSHIITDNYSRDLSQLVQRTNSQIESQLGMVDDAALFISSNPDIISNLSADSASDTPYALVQRKLEIDNQMQYSLYYNYAWDSSLFESIYLFKDAKNYYYLNQYYMPNLYENHLDIYRELTSEGKPLGIYASPKGDNIIYFARMISSVNMKDSLGTIVLGIDENTLKKTYMNTLGYLNAQIYVYKSDGTILSCSNDKKAGTKLEPELLNLSKSTITGARKIGGKVFNVTTYSIYRFKINILILIPQKGLPPEINASMNIYIAVILFGFLLSVVLGTVLSSKITRPIKSLVTNINKFKSGDFSVKMPAYKQYELNELSQVFNRMTDDIQDLFAEIYEKQLLIKESELKFLQAQVNPHFLLNVLDTISWEARTSNNQKIYEMVTSLGQLMIANITFSDKEKLTVSQEKEYIEFYLFLQKMRFGEQLIITIDLDESKIGAFYIPKFSIYTSVENAIVHGLENKVGERRLWVSYRIKDDTLIFEVRDNGVGFDTSDIDLNSLQKKKNEKNHHTHIGLYNANKRIQLLYGKQYGISLERELNQWTKATICLPIDRG